MVSEAGEGYDDVSANQPITPNDFDTNALIDNLVNTVFLPAFNQFESLANTQTEIVTHYCQSVKNQENEDINLKLESQTAWRDLVSQWQQIEVMQMGPLLEEESKLRNAIYSWPVTNQCAVDQDVGHFEAGNISGTPYDITKRTNTRRGLDALEYLLFSPSLQHSCSNESLAPNNWNERTDLSRLIARCEYAIEVATDIKHSANELVNQWQKTDGFSQELLFSGSSVSRFTDESEVLNHISDAMFYIDNITKDTKLAAPIGLSANSCGSAACHQDVESSLSEHSLQNIKYNLLALKQIITGGDNEALGFDDYLIALDAPVLASDLLVDINNAIMAVDDFQGSMIAAVDNNPESIQQIYIAIKKITDNLKSLFITTLSLSLPLTSAGDAD